MDATYLYGWTPPAEHEGYVSSIAYYLQTIFEYDSLSPVDYGSEKALSDTLLTRILKPGAFKEDLDFSATLGGSGLGVPNYRYIWSDNGWDAPNKRFSDELNQEVYDIFFILQSGIKQDIDYSQLEVGVYETTPLLDSLALVKINGVEFYEYLGVGATYRPDRNQLFQNIYKTDSLMTQFSIAPITEYFTESTETNGLMKVTVPYKPETGNWVIVLDPNNKFKEYNEMNNIAPLSPFTHAKSGVLLRLADNDYYKTVVTTNDYSIRERTTNTKFEYRNQTYEAFYGTAVNHNAQKNYAHGQPTENVYNPDVPDTFRVFEGEKMKFYFEIENIGNTASSKSGKLILKAREIQNKNYIELNQTHVIDTIEWTANIEPTDGTRDNNYVVSAEFIPAKYLANGNGITLWAEIIYDEDEERSEREKWMLNNSEFSESRYAKRRSFEFSRIIVDSPNLIIEDIKFPEEDEVTCGDDYPIEITIFNDSEDINIDGTFYINAKDNMGMEESYPVEGIKFQERKTITVHKSFYRNPRDSVVKHWKVNLELDTEDVGLFNQSHTEEKDITIRMGYSTLPRLDAGLNLITGVYSWSDLGDGITYYYEIAITYEGSSSQMRWKGSTDQLHISLPDDLGIEMKYGRYAINLYGYDGKCNYRESLGTRVDFKPPPPPPPPVTHTPGSGGSGGGNSGGGSSGGGSTGGGSNCYTNVSGPAFVSGKLTELSDGTYKYTTTYKNFWDVEVDARLCILRTTGWSCGDARKLKPGKTHTSTTYGVDASGGGARRIILFYPSSIAGSCHFPRP